MTLKVQKERLAMNCLQGKNHKNLLAQHLAHQDHLDLQEFPDNLVTQVRLVKEAKQVGMVRLENQGMMAELECLEKLEDLAW